MKYIKKTKSKFTCTTCNAEFESFYKNATSCSTKCNAKKHSILNRIKNTEKMRLANEEKFKHIVDIPTCKICSYKAKSLQSHLVTHSLTVAQYREQYNVTNDEIFHSSFTKQKSDRIKGSKNPAYQHGGTLSPFSKKFVKYDELSDDETNVKTQEMHKKAHATIKENDNYTSTLVYYTKQGMSEEEAQEALTERQRTFSLKICIEKHGEEAGMKIWQDRQNKWLKSFPKSNYSKISQELFKGIHILLDNTIECFYANVNCDDKNDEFILKTQKSFVKPDFYIPTLKKIIEFDGDYWHAKNTSDPLINRDVERDIDIMNNYPDMQILHIKENNYRKHKDEVIKQCLEFLQK